MTSHPLYLGDVPPSKVLCGFFLIYHPDASLQKGTAIFFLRQRSILSQFSWNLLNLNDVATWVQLYPGLTAFDINRTPTDVGAPCPLFNDLSYESRNSAVRSNISTSYTSNVIALNCSNGREEAFIAINFSINNWCLLYLTVFLRSLAILAMLFTFMVNSPQHLLDVRHITNF